jgi:tetratricopeptide (TPR) repeat protein
MMGQLFHYMIFMKQTLKKIAPFFFLMALGCAQTPEAPPKQTKAQKFQSMHPDERHIWLPPSEEELEERRQRQKRLDGIAAELERLFMGFADILGNEIILENLLRGQESELQQLEARLGPQDAHDEKIRQLNQTLQELEGSVEEMDASLETIRKGRGSTKSDSAVQPDDYRLAILLFRNGQYLKSIAAFQRIMGKEHPPYLEDNILFGLASNHYKLKEYDAALANLDEIIRNHPKGDKWLVSHAMSGLIYNLQGQSAQAVPILESALQHQPNPELLKIINRLLKLAKEGAADASS